MVSSGHTGHWGRVSTSGPELSHNVPLIFKYVEKFIVCVKVYYSVTSAGQADI